MSLRQVFRSKIKDVLHGSGHHGYPPNTNNHEATQQESEPTLVRSMQVNCLLLYCKNMLYLYMYVVLLICYNACICLFHLFVLCMYRLTLLC